MTEETPTVDILAHSELFGHLERRHLERLSSLCHRFHYSPGAVVFREGDRATELYILAEGRVTLDIDIPVVPDRPPVPTAVDVVGPADCCGWSSLVKPQTYRATARCVSPSTGVVISADALREVMKDTTDLGYEVMARLAQAVADYLGHARMRLTTQVARLLDRRDW